MTRIARRVTSAELRQIFNESRLYERANAGEYLQVIERRAPAPAEAGQIHGTMSQMVWYVDDQLNRIVLVHEYRRPDGTLGGSGRPDPKRLLVGDEVWFC